MIKSIEGLVSEIAFSEILDEKVRACTNEITVAKLDIDNFETVNRFYGEFTGDQVIRKLAHVLKNNLSPDHVICRTTKNEFNVMMDATPLETGALMMEEIRAYFDEHLLLIGDPPKEMTIRFSAGIAAYPQNGKTAELLMSAADHAMKLAKKQGKNQIQIARNDDWVEKKIVIRQENAWRLNQLSRQMDKTEAGLLREALQDLLNKYDQRAT
ncbi:GGDEF domain-containing protein [Anoxynatronum sibiricum]|uniref:GGDEF domain-containing protein n=1 Tax=Anoxynatronum sibiricum TaxID=210623 RepID=A0ABU9VRB8_9CLOT